MRKNIWLRSPYSLERVSAAEEVQPTREASTLANVRDAWI